MIMLFPWEFHCESGIVKYKPSTQLQIYCQIDVFEFRGFFTEFSCFRHYFYYQFSLVGKSEFGLLFVRNGKEQYLCLGRGNRIKMSYYLSGKRQSQECKYKIVQFYGVPYRRISIKKVSQ